MLFHGGNWKRPQDEVDALMTLLRNCMKTCLKTAAKNNMCVRVIGDKEGLDEGYPFQNQSSWRKRRRTIPQPAFPDRIELRPGRDEVRRAAQKLARKAAQGIINPEELTEEDFSNALDTAGLPDPDPLIRTCNEQRFPTSCRGSWPIRSFILRRLPGLILQKKNCWKAVEAYNHRDRRFGLVKDV